MERIHSQIFFSSHISCKYYQLMPQMFTGIFVLRTTVYANIKMEIFKSFYACFFLSSFLPQGKKWHKNSYFVAFAPLILIFTQSKNNNYGVSIQNCKWMWKKTRSFFKHHLWPPIFKRILKFIHVFALALSWVLSVFVFGVCCPIHFECKYYGEIVRFSVSMWSFTMFC